MSAKIIAEIGINHQGDIKKAKQMASMAKESGADIAKYQWYEPDDILGRNSPYYAEAKKAQFSWEEHLEIAKHCKSIGIEWAVSAFHLGQIPFLTKAGMRTIKVASRAALNDALLRQMAEENLPMIVSTGLLDSDGISRIKNICGNRLKAFLYCVPKYPTSPNEIQYKKLIDLAAHAGDVGFSSHCPDITCSIDACDRGATIIEHHVTMDKRQQGCDIASSITFHDLKQLVREIRFRESVNLVPVSDLDQVEWLRVQRNHTELYRYFRQDQPISVHQQINWWNLNKNRVKLFLVEMSNERIGYVGFNPFAPGAGNAEFGVFIIPKYQGKGYGAAAIKKLLKIGFQTYWLSTIYSDCLEYPGENRFEFYRRLGFTAYPKEHQHTRYRKQGKMIPSMKFFMTRESWERNDTNEACPLADARTATTGCV